MTVYTRRIWGPAALANAATVMYTVPPATTTVVRNIALINNSTTATHTVRLGVGGTANGQRVMRLICGPESSTYLETRIALHSGEQLYGYVDTVGSVTMTITAYVLDG